MARPYGFWFNLNNKQLAIVSDSSDHLTKAVKLCPHLKDFFDKYEDDDHKLEQWRFIMYKEGWVRGVCPFPDEIGLSFGSFLSKRDAIDIVWAFCESKGYRTPDKILVDNDNTGRTRTIDLKVDESVSLGDPSPATTKGNEMQKKIAEKPETPGKPDSPTVKYMKRVGAAAGKALGGAVVTTAGAAGGAIGGAHLADYVANKLGARDGVRGALGVAGAVGGWWTGRRAGGRVAKAMFGEEEMDTDTMSASEMIEAVVNGTDASELVEWKMRRLTRVMGRGVLAAGMKVAGRHLDKRRKLARRVNRFVRDKRTRF